MAGTLLLNQSIGDYRIVEFLGAGGMGEVYRAAHTKLGRAVAIKLLSPDTQDSGFLRRFWNEARLHASLHHPNIAELYDFLEYQGRPCIVLEYVDGETLSDRIHAAGRLAVDEAVAIVRALSAAMSYVHGQGIVHRDIKAANVRISSRGIVKLLDFGIAKGEATPVLTRPGNVIGTLVYLAPELLRGGLATPQSDVWSLGILFYEMLTGRLPFEGDDMIALVEKVSSASYPCASTLVPQASAAETGVLKRADAIVSRCLRRTPSDRYASATELLADLDQTTPAVSPSARVRVPVQAGRLAERIGRVPDVIATHWTWAAGTAAVCLLLLAVAFWPAPVPAPPLQPPASRAVTRGTSMHRIVVVEGLADVYVNGTFRGRTPFDYEASERETIRLELRQVGFVPLEQTFVVTERPVWTFPMRRSPERTP